MRKLLLTTTALATVASFSAFADGPTVSGSYEWSYSSLTSKDTARDGESYGSDSEIVFKFTNKTDSGLTVQMVTELESDDADTAINEGSINISGGFGKIILGGNDGAADMHNLEAEDVMGEEASPMAASATISTDTDVSLDANDTNKITYIMPAIGGLKAGGSFTSGGVGADSKDTTSFGAQYTMALADANVTLAGTTATQEGGKGKENISHQGLGVKISSGAMTIIAAKSDKDSPTDVIEATGIGASYKLASGTVISAYTMSSEDTRDTGEEYQNMGLEIKYNIASGLNAIVTYNDFEYKKETGTTGAGGKTGSPNDSGTNTKLTIQASF